MSKIFMLLFLSAFVYAGELVFGGVVKSEQEKFVTSRYMGYVSAVNVSEGDSVKKGDVLYVIDSKDIDAQRVQVELQVEQAKLSKNMYQNQLDTVSLNYERHKRLYEKGMIAKYELEQLELHKKNLENMTSIANKQIAQAQEQLKMIKNQYTYLQVKAPNDGIVIAKNVKVGEMAMPGMPAFVISSSEDLSVVADVAQSDVGRLKVGDKVKISIESLGFLGEGSIKAIVPSANPMTHSFKLKVGFVPDVKIYPGMYAKIILTDKE